ncbi:MAG: hypothetical protein MI673_05610, partial [Thiotrichales bacterium]|nr:hypothetical protein [Thiotrichales bacterium]
DCPIMNELFAVMADVYRVTGELPDGADLGPSCDGAAKDVDGSIRRLARLLGIDAGRSMYDDEQWRVLAEYIARRQQERLQACMENILRQRGWPDPGKTIPVIGAGCGRFLIRKIANTLQLPYVDFASLLNVDDAHRSMAADCATAVAVAQLLRTTT